MGSTILFSIFAGIFFIILIILLVIFIKEDGLETFADGGNLVLFGVLLVAIAMCITFNVAFIQMGKLSQKERDSFTAEKQFLEDNLDKKDKYFFKYLDDAVKHNNEVNCNNNKFCRFSIEDRSEYLVDIDYYKSTLIEEE